MTNQETNEYCRAVQDKARKSIQEWNNLTAKNKQRCPSCNAIFTVFMNGKDYEKPGVRLCGACDARRGPVAIEASTGSQES